MSEDLKKTLEIINDIKNRSNNDLVFALSFLNNDFEETKQSIIDLTNKLDLIEIHYSRVLEEYKSRTNTK